MGESCQDFAAISGCRFRSGVLQDFEELRADDSKMRAAMEKAGASVNEFKQRLALREEELMNVLLGAHRLLMTESVRNAIVATCRELQLWPPQPAPAGVLDDDCAYEDTSA